MKTLLFLIASTVVGNYTFGQFGVPFATDNAIWTTRKSTMNPNTNTVVHTYVNACVSGNDTLISSNTYTQVTNCTSGNYLGGIRELNSKIYYMAPDSINEHLLYDFDVTVGQTLNDIIYVNAIDLYDVMHPEIVDLEVTGIETVNFDGLDRVKITVRNLSGNEDGSWIEGIGNTKGLLFESFGNLQNYGIELLCYSEDNAMIYPITGANPCDVTLNVDDLVNQSNSMQIYPNPSSGNVTIRLRSDENLNELSILNTQGQMIRSIKTSNTKEVVLTDLTTGIYFIRLEDEKSVSTQKFVVK